MKQVSELEKGDVVTIIYGNVGSEDLRHQPKTAVVDSVGRKYIKVKYLLSDGSTCSNVCSFDIEFLSDKEWSQRHLFLGTIEELEVARKEFALTEELMDYISDKLSSYIPYEKLKAIKDIIDSPTLGDALAKLCPPPCAGCD